LQVRSRHTTACSFFKTGILAQNLRTGEVRPLAIAISDLQPSTFDLELGTWLFSSSALTWGNEIFAACLPCDLFIVDELGPLELIRGEGWSNALTALRQPTYQVGVVVIRPELVETAQKLLPACKTLSLDPLSAQEFFKLI